MKRTVAVLTFLVFISCTQNVVKYLPPVFNDSNQYLIEKTAYKLPVEKVVANRISSRHNLAVASLEYPNTPDNAITSLIEDQLISKLVLKGFHCIERDDDLIRKLFQESSNDHYSVLPDYRYSTFFDTCRSFTPVESKLNSADYLLTYRILECGILHRKLKDSQYMGRECRVRIHIRLVNAQTGEILIAGPLTAQTVDTILKENMPYLNDYHYQFYSTDLPAKISTVKGKWLYPSESNNSQIQH